MPIIEKMIGKPEEEEDRPWILDDDNMEGKEG
jgi:hypothetical protein